MNLLLERENIDDSQKDGQGKTCREVAGRKEVVRANDGHMYVVLDSRSFLDASYCSLLRSYVLSPLEEAHLPSLLQLLGSPPIFRRLVHTFITRSRTPQGPPLDQAGNARWGRRIYAESQGKDGTRARWKRRSRPRVLALI